MPRVVHQTRIPLPPLNFGHGHTNSAANFAVTGSGIGMGGWRLDSAQDNYIACSMPPIGKQDPSAYYPGRPLDMNMVGIEVFYFTNDNDTDPFDFTYGLQGKAVTEAILTTTPETFTDAPNGTPWDLERATDTLATPIPLDTDEWIGCIFGRLGSSGANETSFPNTGNVFVVGFVINLEVA